MISNGIDIGMLRKNFEVLCKSLGLMLDAPEIPLFEGVSDDEGCVLLTERVDKISIPLNWIFRPQEAQEYVEKLKKHKTRKTPCFDETISEMSYIRMMTPYIYPAGMGNLPIRVLFTGLSELTNEYYAVVYYDTDTDALSYQRWFKGDACRILRMTPDKEYRWLNWVSINGIQYPITDSYIASLYHRVYDEGDFPLRSNIDTMS